MIEIKNLNKYFNKGKKNEIHAINNTSLTLPDSGLVALLGESGCGKTTMLNAIGGLDKVKSGSIFINGKKITSKSSHNVDKIRNLSVGYIFQDYKLMDDMTVYDNVALALKMIGIKDKKEIEVRVEYVLDKVGILRYRSRPTSTLSGGERQRVGIARALVKNPDIILADEPTGNLDSKNSVEIMNIIKKISSDRLVILVTHERPLAEFYADRIIELVDGSVVADYENDHSNALNYEVDNVFYLKEFENHAQLFDSTNDRKVNLYDNGDTNLSVNIIVKNGNIYIQALDGKNVEIIDKNSSIEVIDDYKQEINREDIEDYDFDLSSVGNQNLKKRYSSIYNIFSAIVYGFKKIFGYPALRKILLLGFALSGLFVIYSVGQILAINHVVDSDFLTTNKNYVIVNKPSMTAEEYEKLEAMDEVLYVIPSDSKIALHVALDDYYQTNDAMVTLTGSLASSDLLTKDDLIAGRLPENEKEIVFDKMIYDKYQGVRSNAQMAGVFTVKDFVGRTMTLDKEMGEYTIVGITDMESPSIYAKESELLNIVKYSYDAGDSDMYYYMRQEYTGNAASQAELTDYKRFEDRIILYNDWRHSEFPVNDYEVLLPDSYMELYPIGKETKLKVDDKPLVVSGYYKSDNGEDSFSAYFVNENMIKHQLVKNSKTFAICTKNKAEVLENLLENNYKAYDAYEKDQQDFNEERKSVVLSTTILGLVMLGISLIEMFLMSRSSFLSRIKEVGMLRAIGAKKFDIYKMFMGEIIAITTLTSLPAMIFMYYAESYLVKSVVSFKTVFYMPLPYLLISILAVYVFNLVIGLLPVWNTMRKRPAAILARKDVD